MRAIWKFRPNVVSRYITHELPRGARFLDMQTQDGGLAMWFLVDTEAPLVTERFVLFETGEDLSNETGVREYVGTVQVRGGYVAHVFKLAPPESLSSPVPGLWR